MKSEKREIAEGIELPNQENIWTTEEKENCKFLEILEAHTIKQVETKEEKNPKNKKHTTDKREKVFKTKLCSRKLIKGMNKWAVPLCKNIWLTAKKDNGGI